MACCGNSVDILLEAKRQLEAAASAPVNTEEPMVRMKFVGPQEGTLLYGGPNRTPSSRVYPGGRNSVAMYQDVLEEDVNWLLATGLWEIVNLPAAVPTPPTAEEVYSDPIPLPADVKRPGRPRKKAEPKPDAETED